MIDTGTPVQVVEVQRWGCVTPETWSAFCPCGYDGPGRDTLAEANGDAADHIADHAARGEQAERA